MAFGGHFLTQSSDRFIQCVYFIHFIDSPSPLLSMPSKHGISMAINTKGNAGILQALFEVMGFAWGVCLANRTWEIFNPCKMQPLFCVQFIVQVVAFNSMRAEYWFVLHTSMRASAALIKKRYSSSRVTASLMPSNIPT
jgi:hypothetical protein